MLIMIVAVDGNVCKHTASTATIISAKADCRYLLGTLALSALELREGYLGRVSPHRNKLRLRHSLGDGLAVRAPLRAREPWSHLPSREVGRV